MLKRLQKVIFQSYVTFKSTLLNVSSLPPVAPQVVDHLTGEAKLAQAADSVSQTHQNKRTIKNVKFYHNTVR